ncbi:MAG: hypothetical protein KDA27_26350, partial [Candidatus Eisenbacteria bacterium]|nr:hypothetical protein [Candidatus Eisenbacteria bacterium]
MAAAMRTGASLSPREALPTSGLEWGVLGVGLALLLLSAPGVLRFLWNLDGADSERRSPIPKRFFLAVGLAVGLFGISILAPGEPTILDSKCHVARIWLFARDFGSGVIPRWTDFWYGGLPADLHYPPLAHLLGTVPCLLGSSPEFAVKLVAWLSVVACGIGFAALAGTLHRSRSAAIVGGLVGALAPAVHAAWVWEGRLPGILFLGILPWAFLSAEVTARGRSGIRGPIALGLAIWLLIIAHVGQARPALVILLAFTALRYWDLHRASPGWRVPLYLALGWGIGGVLSATFLLPMVVETPWVNQLRPENAVSVLRPHLAESLRLFRWSPRGVGVLGPSVLLLAVVGAWRTFGRRRDDRDAPSLVTLLILLGLPWFLCQPFGRGLDLIFLGGILIAPGAVVRLPRRMLGLVLLLILVDVAPPRLVSAYSAEAQRASRNRVYEDLEASMTRGRMLELAADAEGRVSASDWRIAPHHAVATLAGPFIQGVPLDYRFTSAMIDTLASGIEQGRLRSAARSAVSRPDSTNVAGPGDAHDAKANDVEGGIELPTSVGRLLRFHGAEVLLIVGPSGPILLPIDDPVLMPQPDLPGLRVRDATLVHWIPPGAPGGPPRPDAAIGMYGLPPAAADNSAARQLEWIERVGPVPVASTATVLPNRLLLRVPESPAGTLRIARSAYPGTRLFVDGKQIPWTSAPL